MRSYPMALSGDLMQPAQLAQIAVAARLVALCVAMPVNCDVPIWKIGLRFPCPRPM